MSSGPAREPEFTAAGSRELETLRLKLGQLHESLSDFLQIHPHSPWPVVQSQFSTLLAKYETIVNELGSDVLKQLLVFPKSLPVEDPDFLPRVLLRTKLIPEIEESYADTKKRASMETISNASKDETAAARAWRYQAKANVDRHDDIADGAYDTFKMLASEYDFKLRIADESDDEDEEEEEEDEVGDDDGDAMDEDEAPNSKPSHAAPVTEERRKAIIEAMLKRISSGPAFL
ncbi:uncharacterized protein BJ171DRAFT_210865 [Polychytrium aggregatum]|uniref:uncharacterized protein n=1 Tax=Polychytrium aggregatum TaxID=110093 RepID=UPI0022FED833|nr:uncharacterized protein BJ171DRAFT_210865 [Polychytrium aggregatum]KAI9208601.1 hypothetical protein BJ171DRAFT_210865 [Polychytrium aggregatum]